MARNELTSLFDMHDAVSFVVETPTPSFLPWYSYYKHGAGATTLPASPCLKVLQHLAYHHYPLKTYFRKVFCHLHCVRKNSSFQILWKNKQNPSIWDAFRKTTCHVRRCFSTWTFQHQLPLSVFALVRTRQETIWLSQAAASSAAPRFAYALRLGREDSQCFWLQNRQNKFKQN